MRYCCFVLLFYFMVSCTETMNKVPFTTLKIDTIYEDSLSSFSAIEVMGNSLAFAANKGTFGTIDLTSGKIRFNIEKYHTSIPSFRAVAHTPTDFFMLSIENPALLYKTGEQGKMDLVYKEEGDGVFYDSMTFWNRKEGIAVGDSVEGCLSIIITRDGGHTWQKTPCSELPEGMAGEGAFAASNTNIATMGNKAWIATTKRIWFSPDRGKTWETFETPIASGKETQGMYSLDFYDETIGFAIGGDYTDPDFNTANKALTKDGGKTWQLVANGQDPGYKSCVQFVPNSQGEGLVALGFTGIAYSADAGNSWKQLSEEGFYTLRFLNDSVAYAGGKGSIAKLTFK